MVLLQGSPAINISMASSCGDKNSYGEPLDQPLTVCWEPYKDLHDVHTALSRLNLNGADCLVQVWILMYEGSLQTLQTSRVPFAIHDNHEGHLRSFRDASIKYTYVVGNVSSECTGIPGRVMCRGSAQCIENVQDYAKQLYPQLEDAVNCGVRGCLFLPLFQSQHQYPVGVIELAMLEAMPSFAEAWKRIYTAFKAVNLDVPIPTLPDNKKKGKWKLDRLIPEVIEPCFYKMKLGDAATKFGVCESTLRTATRSAGYNEWPLVEILKASPTTENNTILSLSDCNTSKPTVGSSEVTNCSLEVGGLNGLNFNNMEGALNDFNFNNMEGGLNDFNFNNMEGILNNFNFNNMEGALDDFNFNNMEGVLNDFNFNNMEGALNGLNFNNMEGVLNDLNFNNMEGALNGLNCNNMEEDKDEDILIYENTLRGMCDNPFLGF